jgi:hypothetical protein
MADCFCQNPCYWFGANSSKSGMCDCSTKKAINF